MSNMDIQYDGRWYSVHISHSGLHKYKVIRGRTKFEVQQMAQAQLAQWQEAWDTRTRKEWDRAQKEQDKAERELAKQRDQEILHAKKNRAAELTAAAAAEVTRLQGLLSDTLKKDDRLDWDALKDNTAFSEPKPQIPRPSPPTLPALPRRPERTDPKYQPDYGMLDRLIPSRKQQLADAASGRFVLDCRKWEQTKASLERQAQASQQAYQESLRKWQAEVKEAESKWEIERQQFEAQKARRNGSVELVRAEYLKGSRDAIIGYCDLVLSRSQYPSAIPKATFKMDYDPEVRLLVVEYSLPSPENMPEIKEVKYVQSRDELQQVPLSPAVVNELYDSVLYQIALRTIHELFEVDTVNALDVVVFNGWVSSIDKSTGQKVNACILSVQTRKQEFMSINLARVEPKTCFKNLKGVASAKLHGLAAVAPIMQLNHADKRFVSSRDVAANLDAGVNIAAMDWEDFEHLIRELFAREFSQGGGEVKVTQASRDGGVDAVAFDPDPIRGGKIVIQAKRYTNTVGVSAVRDLYGTVLNEGATKGILVTTAQFGPDAYDFAKDKPLALLNGANLLHLLEKHGHKGRIDLAEAKRLQTGQ